MKERPILFSGEMVRAILDGRKTQTRRMSGLEDINKNPGIWSFNRYGELDYMTKKQYKGRFGAYFQTQLMVPGTMHVCPVSSPYGKPGDRLWVRETWTSADENCNSVKTAQAPILYKANSTQSEKWIWFPSIHMPRWASRITLQITEVRVERVQDISEEDALAEGVDNFICPQCGYSDAASYGATIKTRCASQDCGLDYLSAVEGFQNLWDSLNGKKHPWESNPWVWAISFRRVEG